MKKVSLFCLIVALTSLPMPGSVDAGLVIGGACVPDSDTIRTGVHETAGFGVRFGGSAIGTIRLICTADLEDLNKIGGIVMNFIDEDGMGAGARVRAHLRRAAIGTNIGITVGSCDSNTSNNMGPQVLWCKFPSKHTRVVKKYYWFEIVIERSRPTQKVEFLSVGPVHPASPYL